MPKVRSRDDVRMRRVQLTAAAQGGVLSRRQLYAAGITRWELRAQRAARRWSTIGDQTVCVHCGPVSETGLRWAAVFQGGPRALLDVVAALQAGGLVRFREERIRVSVPRGARVRRNARFDIRQTRRWSADDVMPHGVPRTKPAVAVVRSALWARSDRQAALLLTMTVQQGLASPEEIGREMLRIRRDRRRVFAHTVVNDLLDGARSLGEIDVARECRRRRFPEPNRQILRRDARNRYYLDIY